ncbi:MAG: gliding motility-associated C-terminal domain-containing protein, partial [Bacteroidetes bacterium]|nr:gliding motility-associated C-terminal domain-containing protein [Bacteroidota bacterium]
CEDTMQVTVRAKPDAGPDQNICQRSTATMAAVGTGSWSAPATNPSPLTFTNASSATTAVSGFTSVGIYSIVWTSNGCTDTMDVNVSFVPSVAVSDTAICSGQSATLTAVPDQTGGSYLWSTGDVTQSITVSPATLSHYTVTYTLGICSSSDTATVTVRTLPVVTVGIANALCTATNGQAWAIVTGTGPYTYQWNDPSLSTTDTISSLANGSSYSVVATDTYGCTGSNSGTVGLDNPTITIVEVSRHDLRCHGDNSGSITIHAQDTASMTYIWSGSPNPSGTTVVSGLPAGSYSVAVTDAYGCTGSAGYTLTEPQALVLPQVTGTDPTCPGSATGTATASPTGGSGTLHYSWSATPPQNTATATNLTAGTYDVTVTDDSLCSVSGTVTLSDPGATTFGSGAETDARCHGSADGTATVSPQGAFGPYTYHWNDPALQTGATATGLTAGTYTVVVTDSRGCTVSTNVTIGEPGALVPVLTQTNLRCYHGHSGTATVTVTGGTLPYSYQWNDLPYNTTGPTLTNGDAQITYTVTVTDGLGCTLTQDVTFTEPLPLQLTVTATGTTCAATVDGTITGVAADGAAPYTYSLQDITGNTIQTNATGLFEGLGAQFYTVVATDANGCRRSDTITVQRAPFNVYEVIADSTSCYGPEYTDGRIHIDGFTYINAPFLYALDGGMDQDIPDFYDLGAGPHTLTITDVHGCDTTMTVIVGEPLPASVDILPGDSTIAEGAGLQLSTAFRPYSTDSIKSYAWSPAAGLSCIDCPDPLATPYSSENTYTVTVTYNQGCMAVTTVHINTTGDPPVYIPNAFSPNGDGNNDVFYVYGEGIKTLRMTIFNRWGEKVFESDNQSQGWDGTYRGVLQEPGIYIYVVDLIYLNDHKRVKDGSITLIR